MLSDLRFAFRALCKSPGFTAAALLILAIGIGANTAVFSVVEAILLRPLPYARAGELVLVKSAVGNQVGLFNLAEYGAYRDQSRAFQALAAAASFNTTWVDRSAAQLVQGLRVSANTFDLLGVTPAAGRLLTANDDRPDAAKVVVISDAFWHRVYAGSPDVLGRSILIDGENRTVVGVMPAGFVLPLNSFHSDVCVPLQADSNPARHNGAALHYMRVFGRLAPGVTAAQALGHTQTVLAQLRREFPADFIGQPNNTLTPLADEIVGDTRPVLLTLLGVVASLLLLASANLAGLLLVRGLARQREFAIRSALGCSRFQLMRLLLAECLLLAVGGGVAGFLLAQWNMGAIVSLLPSDLPRAQNVQFNGLVLAFTTIASLAAGVLPAVAPLWWCSRMDLREAANAGGRGNTAGAAQLRLRHLLASVQIALALGLLACTALFLRSFWAVDTQLPAADPAHVITARLTLPQASYRDRDALVHFYEQLRVQLEGINGVSHVGTTSLLPLASGLATTEFTISGRPAVPTANQPSANYRLVTPGYFEAMGIVVRDGRAFADDDNEHHPLSVVVSAALARAFFPNQRVLGQRLEINDSLNGYRTFEIVGVVADVKQQKMEDAPSYDVYIPFRQMDAAAVPWIRLRNFWVLRAMGPEKPVEDAFRRAVQSIDPGVPVASVSTMEQVVDSALAVRRFTLIVIGFLAAAAILLTTAGVYATIAYGVAQRTREIGVRLALGATAAQIFRLVVSEGMMLGISGVVLGLAIALALSRLTTSQLYGVSPRDPAAMAAAASLLFAIALIASAVPARRASRVNPIEAMRTE